ncbi:prominin-1-A-like isoform X2 [Megalops cyprinoides]|uniref:prominin-1-A-like isoform X2 n=1 Tax=Megalops cyprinoides TaxID=118141 RepID=UPI00186431E4|nr:prominin-1-A-like isoform X2 [Megalops cyprinoides]
MLGKVGLLFLACCWGITPSEPRPAEKQSQQGTLDFGFVPAGVYETHAYYEPRAIGILFHMVHTFLYVVQPNPFPKDLIVKLAQQNLIALQTEYQKAIYYEIGFIVCASLGVLFVLLMPLVGFCFCMCRCCENCGGEMHQRQRKNADCRRGFFTTLLIATSVIISAGVLCAYAANQNLTNQIKDTRRLVNTNIRDLKAFANQTPSQIDYLATQYTTAKNKALSDLDNIGYLLGNKIHAQLGREVLPALDAALSMASAMRETKEALESVSAALETLQDGTSKLQNSLNNVRSSLGNTLNDPACSNGAVSHTCNTIRGTLSQLGINANFATLPEVSQQLATVNVLLKTDLSNIVQRGYSSFNDTPTMVEEQTKNVVAGVKSMLDGVSGNITAFTKMFPIQASLANFTVFLTEQQMKMEALYPQIDQMDFYRWIGCVVLCCMVVLILAFNFLGLLCGICGYDKHASPTTRGCLSNTGGILLMAGVGFSFIFSWVLMAVVTTTFVVGGNVEKLVCEPFESRQLFKILDTPYMVNPGVRNVLPNMLFQKPDLDLTLESVYINCKENRGLYAALKLENIFNVNIFMNNTVYTKDMSKLFDEVKVDFRGVVLLETAGRENLMNFANSGVGEINYAAYLSEVNKGVTLVDLLSFANELEGQADQLPRGALENALKGHASSIRQIHSQQVVPMEQAMSSLSQSIRVLQRSATDLPNKINHVLIAIDAAEYLITQNASYVVKQETQKYMKNIVGYFRQYTDWVKTSLAMEVAPCKPISNILDSMEIVACSFIVDSLNTFWFGLGCCAMFLIPSIIFSVKLAKFYRRMDTEDVYDDVTIPMKTVPSYDTMSRFPRASAPPRHADW